MKCIFKAIGQCPASSECLGDLCPIENIKPNGNGATDLSDEAQETLIGEWLRGELDPSLTVNQIRNRRERRI